VLDSDPVTLQVVSSAVEGGVAEPTVSDTYPLSRARGALDRSADGHVRGKLVLEVTEDADE
jgi:NADPH:quinone reductase-like Zn-dependent oxidoreductase